LIAELNTDAEAVFKVTPDPLPMVIADPNVDVDA
jgi:hypothetical protein